MTIGIGDIPILQRSSVRMRNPEDVFNKIDSIVSGKKETLQIITDYDFTLTKQHVNGIGTLSSFGLLSLWDQLPEGFMNKDMAIKERYYPYEVDLNMTPEEKTPYMIEWYKASENLWKGVQFNLSALIKLIAEKGPELRDGTVELCRILEKNKIPLLVLSAGLGDVLTEVLKYHGLTENDHFHIISNFFKLNKDSVVEGYGVGESGCFIHPFNKSGLGCGSYFKKMSCKQNVILMGDSLGDAKMDQGVPDINTVLKIGFLYGTERVIEKSLPSYLQCFDIVLVDDQSMDVLRAVIDLVVSQ
ncbi:hypothetical protein RUM43_000806 [Polyplax serrata]|uniref:5'-nucleotidase n=1 Tax=Polyplax serrata TaxID=468196 RepID=A0AAN8SEF0_POLSC